MDPLLLIAGLATLGLAGALVYLDVWVRARARREWDNDRQVELAAWRAEWLVGVPDPYGTVPTSEHSGRSLYSILAEPNLQAMPKHLHDEVHLIHHGSVPVARIREHEALSLDPKEYLG